MSRASLEQLGNLAGDIDKLEATRQRLLVKRDVMIRALADKQFKSSAICDADTETFCNQCAWHGKYQELKQ